MPKYLAILMLCFCCSSTASEVNQSVPLTTSIAPITRIIRNYEKHLLKLKERYENLHVKQRRLKERSTDSSADSRDEVIDDWTKKGEDDKNNSFDTGAPIALSPFELPVLDIGLLPEPSTDSPKFPHRRRLKYLTEYSKRRPATSTNYEDKEALITGDSINGIESILDEQNKETLNDSVSESPISRVDGGSKLSGQMKKQENDFSSMDALIESVRRRENKINKVKEEKGKKVPKTYSIVNLFKASINDESKPIELELNNENRSRIIKEKPMQKYLPIKKLFDLKTSNQHGNKLSFNSDEKTTHELPFLTRPDLFDMLSTSTTKMPYTFATTTIQPTTTQWSPTIFVKEHVTTPGSPQKEKSSFVTESSASIERQERSDKSHTKMRDITEQPRHLSTIVDSMEGHQLEPADLNTLIEFGGEYNRGQRRRHSREFYVPGELDDIQYLDDNDDEIDFPFYSRKKYRNQHYRFGYYRRKVVPRPYYDDNEEEEMMDFYPRRPVRKGLRFPARVQKHQAIPLPLGSSYSGENEAFKSKHKYSKLKSGIAGEHRLNLPAYEKTEAPSPEEQQKTSTTTQKTSQNSNSDLQMSPENCRKVHNYSVMFGVPDPQAWVRKNCSFVQTFVKAPCEDISTFVDSCYRV